MFLLTLAQITIAAPEPNTLLLVGSCAGLLIIRALLGVNAE